MGQVDNCQYCRKPNKDMYYGFIAMSPPIPEMEERKQKWGEKWWENLEREDLTEEEYKDLDGINLYDQLLNTIGRGKICISCLEYEDRLLNKYYPKINLTNIK